jgi:hypothetical protein
LGLFRINFKFYILIADAGADPAAVLPMRECDWWGAAGSNRRSFELISIHKF